MAFDEPETLALLRRSADGDAAAQGALLELLYDELHRRAAGLMRAEGLGHTLQPTALVHEAFLRLDGLEDAPSSRAHFLALAARTMRRVLVDHARRGQAEKRGGGAGGVTLASWMPGAEGAEAVDLLSLEDALIQLAELDARGARVVELRYFGGLTEPEVAAELEVSERTVRGDWAHARAWLHRKLFADGPP